MKEMKELILTDVRLSYPALFIPTEYKNDGKFKYRATFLLDKSDIKTKARIDEIIKEILAEEKLKSLSPEKLFIRDGDEEGSPGYWIIKASDLEKPKVIDKNKNLISKDDDVTYPGCYVNAGLKVSYYNAMGSKRIIAFVKAVKFVKDGERFGKGSSGFDVDKLFTDEENAESSKDNYLDDL